MSTYGTERSFRIVEVAAPQDLDSADAAPFLAMVDLFNLTSRADAGHDGLAMDAAAELPAWHDQTDERRIALVAVRGGLLLGGVLLYAGTAEDTANAEYDLLLHPDHADAAVADALIDAAEQQARAWGLRVVQAWTLHVAGEAAAAEQTLTAPTGFGIVSAASLRVQALQQRGYALGQITRNSLFDLRVEHPDTRRRLDEAITFAGPDYRVVTWTAPTPPEFRDGYARGLARMHTDAPQGELTLTPEHFDADRVARRDRRFLDGGYTVGVAAIIHVPTGELVAYNELARTGPPDAPTAQWGTLVLREHRGHRLGTIIKCVNLLRWPALAPGSPVVSTFNAEENRPMLDINEEIGFVPASHAAVWQRELT